MLRRKIPIAVALLILLVSPALAIGQDLPAGKWWHSDRIEKRLSLSKAEKEALDQAYIDSRRKLIDLKSTMEREQFELETLLEEEALDETALMKQFQRLEGARADLSTERFNFLIQVRKTLGYERFQQIKMLYDMRHRKKSRNGGPMDRRGRDFGEEGPPLRRNR